MKMIKNCWSGVRCLDITNNFEWINWFKL